MKKSASGTFRKSEISLFMSALLTTVDIVSQGPSRLRGKISCS